MIIVDTPIYYAQLILTQLHYLLWLNWGLAIIALALLTRIILFPIGLLVSNYQKQVSTFQSQLAPIIQNIKLHYKGEEAHHHLIDAHKALGISPFFTLKPMIGLLVQIPILVIVFNALAKMPALNNTSFLWISNLAKPDVVIYFPVTIPYLGNGVHLLPFIMTAISCISTYFYKNEIAPKSVASREKTNVYIMAFAFLIMFYPFPASMVLYWTAMNFLQYLQQQITGMKGI